MMKKFIVGEMAILSVALMAEVTFAFPCAGSKRSGDINVDGVVDLHDFAILANRWLESYEVE